MPLQGYIFDWYCTINNNCCKPFYEIYKGTAAHDRMESTEHNFDISYQSFAGENTWCNSQWSFLLLDYTPFLYYINN